MKKIVALLCALVLGSCNEKASKPELQIKVDFKSLLANEESRDLLSSYTSFFINVKDLQAPRATSPNTVASDQNARCLGFEAVSDLIGPDLVRTQGIPISLVASLFDQRIELYGVKGLGAGPNSWLSTYSATSQIYLLATVSPVKLMSNTLVTLAPTAATIEATDRFTQCRLSDKAFSVGGVVTGLSSSGLILKLNEGDPVSIPTPTAATSALGGTPFTFSQKLGTGAAFNVTIASQPTTGTCVVLRGSGKIASSNVVNVGIVCGNNPQVTSVNPSHGTPSGGTIINISGSNFGVGSTLPTVQLVGATEISNCPVSSATAAVITCATTAHANSESVTVKVINPDGGVGQLANGFLYANPPLVTSVSPDNGAYGSSTTVLVTGTNFVSGTTIDFILSGNVYSCGSPNLTGATTITCTVPVIGLPGNANLRATNPNGLTTTSNTVVFTLHP